MTEKTNGDIAGTDENARLLTGACAFSIILAVRRKVARLNVPPFPRRAVFGIIGTKTAFCFVI